MHGLVRGATAVLLALAAVVPLSTGVGPVAAQEGAVGPPEARSVSVTPSTGLVDDQRVLLRGSGFAADLPVEYQQCRRGEVGQFACAPSNFNFTFTNSAGRFAARLRVEAVVDLIKGPFDCRLSAGRCEIRMRGFAGGTWIKVPLSFVPDAPLATPPTLTVSPAADLLDGQIVSVTGSGFHQREDLSLYACPLGATSTMACDGDYLSVHTEGQGGFDLSYSVAAVLEAEDLVTDCRVSACELVAFTGDGFTRFRNPGRAPLSFTSDGALRPPPTLVATPATGLVGGQRVAIHGEGFRPLASFLLLECTGVAGDVSACGFDFREPPPVVTADAEGDFDGEFAVRPRYRRLADNRERNCRVQGCSVAAVSFGGLSLVPARITFAPR
jgi:hypothetical protein